MSAIYRAVFNLSFLSKTVERVVVVQLKRHLALSGLMPLLQSSSHSTETSLLRIMSDVFAANDQQHVTRHLSAAFDCVDHNILLLRLERVFRLSGHVLSWLRSFMTDWTQCVAYAGVISLIVELL